jgi:hypothetical protein
MGVTVQVRDLDPAVNERLKGAATAKGLSYSEYLRRELTRIAERLRIEDRWSETVAEHRARTDALFAEATRPFEPLDVATDEIVRILREEREER